MIQASQVIPVRVALTVEQVEGYEVPTAPGMLQQLDRVARAASIPTYPAATG